MKNKKLNVGDIIKPGYSDSVYEVVNILRGCTCPEYIRSLNGDNSPSPPHLHLTVVPQGEKNTPRNYKWINGINEETLESVWKAGSEDAAIPPSKDHISIIGQANNAQPELF